MAFKILLTLKYQPSEIQRIFKDIVNKGMYVNEQVKSDKEMKFGKYLDKLMKHTNLYIKREKKSTETFLYFVMHKEPKSLRMA